MKTTKRLLVLLLSLVLIFSFAACQTKPADTSSDETSEAVTVKPDVPENRRLASARTGANDTNPLVLSSGTMDGKFNPFYATSAYDTAVVGMTQITLITNSTNAEPVAGIGERTFAYSYKMSVSEDESKSTYEFILKNGITFSDGTPVTGKDVLFNMYTYLDPAYTGSSTLYSMDIVGLQSYRTQVLDPAVLETMTAENRENAEAAVAAYLAGESVDEDELAGIWEAVRKCLVDDSGALIKYVYVPSDFGYDEPDDFLENYSKSIILVYLGALSYDAETEEWTLDESTGLDVAKLSEYSEDEFIAAGLEYVKANMTAADYDAEFGYETVTEGTAQTAIDEVIKSYELAYLEENKGNVKSVSGITLDTVTDDQGVERERLTVVINGVDPKAIWNFSFEIAPMSYYSTDALAAAANGVDAFGVDFASNAFQEQLKVKVVPVGAGPYKAADSQGNPTTDSSKFFADGMVYFVANDDFMLSAPLIKYIRYKTINLGAELSNLKSGEVHYSDPSANADRINEIAGTNLKHILVDNLGYGYIGINAQLIPDLYARRAIAHALNTEASLEFYPGGLASIIYRGMSKVSWAYPDDADNKYPYDASGEVSKALFLQSDKFKEVDGKVVYANGNPVTYTFSLPSAAADHPAGQIFIDARDTLAKIGVTVTIETDSSLLGKLQDNVIEVWAAAWQATIDPDMYQVYYSGPENTAGSPKSMGLYWLFDNGTADEKEMLKDINELIVQARKSLNVEERKPVYSEALDLIMDVCVEIPTYQRKNMFVYNSEVIDGDSLWDEVTPYRGPLWEIWNVSLILD